MRCLDRDKQWVLISFFVEKRACRDEQGRLTGRHEIVRSDPIPCLLSVSASKGTAESSPFGIDLDYDKTIIIEDVDIPVSESCVFWIDNVDQKLFDEGFAGLSTDEGVDPGFSFPSFTDMAYDYTVKRIARCPNSIAVAVKHVEVSK